MHNNHETRSFTPTYILNIGMKREGGKDLTLGEIHLALGKLGLVPLGEATIAQSSTEPTAVLRFEGKPNRPVIHRLAHELGQEAIASLVLPSAYGYLDGPNAKAWGEFDPEQFLMPNGRPFLSFGTGARIGEFGDGK